MAAKILILLVVIILVVGCEFAIKPSYVREEVDINSTAEEFCGNEGVDAVYVCNEHIRVISSIIGGGSIFYRKDMSEIECPLVEKSVMTSRCKELLFETECRKVC